jgi:hypothetical protein
LESVADFPLHPNNHIQEENAALKKKIEMLKREIVPKEFLRKDLEGGCGGEEIMVLYFLKVR